ncbi:hypothetical protein N7509_013429 [Penicillium cosmopolitanum]|uniref:Xylose isomerase-like TIM barrel domain-containing protein n=1 Tax=Penicillium cosmopolitanum TaxID=1131564 RepID=A0A9W9SHY9_9EURO|nr:uncharacterized protein N7509_013429 [Penicillium cosmopolitanum]KAJ5376543.1 hypothetical protein N7509_013429 [Penicillium cosmopolitanum]
MGITRHRTTWGVDKGGPGLENWKAWFPELKKHGYNGVEIDIHQLDPVAEFPRLRELLDQVGLEMSVLAHSSWVGYVGPRPVGLDAQHHLQNYRDVLQSTAVLRPVAINFQSGQDTWTVEESVKFYQGTLQVDKELGLTGHVFHETHRNRSLSTPYHSLQILQAVPELKITADFSHWMVCCERILDISDEDRTLLDEVIPRVGHLHARIGTTQASQCPEPLNPIFEQERLCMERLWTKIIESYLERNGPNASLVFVPEYGPFPYHPYGSAKAYGTVADEEGVRLEALFKQVIARKSGA